MNAVPAAYTAPRGLIAPTIGGQRPQEKLENNPIQSRVNPSNASNSTCLLQQIMKARNALVHGLFEQPGDSEQPPPLLTSAVDAPAPNSTTP
jgi:hypothetical protein